MRSLDRVDTCTILMFLPCFYLICISYLRQLINMKFKFNYIFPFWYQRAQLWLKLALSRANRRSATYYGSGSAPAPGTASANVSHAAPRRGSTMNAYDSRKAIRSTHIKLTTIKVNTIYKSDYHFRDNYKCLSILPDFT